MKKFIFGLILTFMMSFSVNAQIVTENAKLLDNTYVTVQGGVSTPLTLDAVFPVNPSVTIALGKQLTPVVGVEVEGTAMFGSHTMGGTTERFDGTFHNIVRGTYVGLNGTLNWSNLLFGYKGTPRFVEVSTVTGLGWLHGYKPNTSDAGNNSLGVKTGANVAFNLGKTKAHTVFVQPAVLWNMTNPGSDRNGVAFNRYGAQLYLGVGYTYHFKTSNGTHHFKQHDLGKYLESIDYLEMALAEKPKEVIVEKIIIKEVQVDTKSTVVQQQLAYVFFAQNSAELTDEAKAELDKVEGTVTVTATASPEGNKTYNQTLSQKRADAVKAYLESRGVTVQEATGLGVTGKTSNRVSKVTAQ